MNRRQAISECKKFWKPAVGHPEMGKAQLLELNPFTKKYVHECPLCQYVAIKSRDIGIGCLISYRPGKECRQYCPLVIMYKKSCLQLGCFIHPDKFAKKVMRLKVRG